MSLITNSSMTHQGQNILKRIEDNKCVLHWVMIQFDDITNLVSSFGDIDIVHST